MAKFLIKNNAQVEGEENRLRPLVQAAIVIKDEESLKIIDLLIEHGAQVNAQDSKNGNTVLHSIFPEIIFTMPGTDTGLAFKKLIECGADHSIKNKGGKTALDLAQ